MLPIVTHLTEYCIPISGSKSEHISRHLEWGCGSRSYQAQLRWGCRVMRKAVYKTPIALLKLVCQLEKDSLSIILDNLSSMAENLCQNICLAFLLVLSIWNSLALCRLLNQEHMLKRHEEWMALNSRIYADAAEKEKRYAIFKENVERIVAFNNGVERGYKLGVINLQT
ncbi:hypothetical protein QUC31_012790 [Theobroma cacao]